MKSLFIAIAISFMALGTFSVHQSKDQKVYLQLTEASAQSAQAPAEAVPPPTYLDGVIKAIGGLPAASAYLVMIFEFILRVVPTAKPLSVLTPLQYFCADVSIILKSIGDFLQQLIDSANRLSK